MILARISKQIWYFFFISKTKIAEDERRLSTLIMDDDNEGVNLSDDEGEEVPKRPMTGKEARRLRSAKVTKEVEEGNMAYDEDFYK